MKTVMILAGLSVEAHDRIRRENASSFAPNGKLIVKPLPSEGYTAAYAKTIIDEAHSYVHSLKENDEACILMCYVGGQDNAENTFLANFFPFALVRNINPIDTSTANSKNEKNKILNDYFRYILSETIQLRGISRSVKEKTEIRNLTPLLLPVVNFRSDVFIGLMNSLFHNLGRSTNVSLLLQNSIDEFFRHHPKARPNGDRRYCFSDGRMYFKSPGSDRHGFRRTNGTGHTNTCLLNARSRLGGTFDHQFHYDCSAVKGSLAAGYPNCHGVLTPPKPTHVNIAPNDYII